MTPPTLHLWVPTDPRRARHRGWVECSEREHATRIALACLEAEQLGIPVELVEASCAELEAAARELGVDPATPDGRAAAVATMRGTPPPRITPKPRRGRPRTVDAPDLVAGRLPSKVAERFRRKCERAGILPAEGVRRAVTRWTEEE